ncbi:fucolectin-1-like [Haliotis rufescens]|uniref:fucolectin-1-like n=1 Tax=Haliotis rufescens TaxID=6454 RepID=UPI00201ED460|nr:fucolectin-1-like [Haliotis rufescens]
MYNFFYDINYLVHVVNGLCMYLTSACTLDMLQYGKRQEGSTFKVVEKSNLFSCATECASYRVCKSFNLDLDRHTCHLNQQDDVTFEENQRNTSAFIYSRITPWNEITLTPCQGVSCGYGQRCVVRRNGDVQCEDVLQNIAPQKPTAASSVWSLEHPPSAAANGRVSGRWVPGNCFAVDNNDYTPWWQVDLLATCIIVEVRVTSRDSTPERLHDFALDVYREDPRSHDDATPQLCFMYNGAVTEPGKTEAINCTSPVTGRYLRISGKKTQNSQDVLQFCEVQVFAFSVIY